MSRRDVSFGQIVHGKFTGLAFLILCFATIAGVTVYPVQGPWCRLDFCSRGTWFGIADLPPSLMILSTLYVSGDVYLVSRYNLFYSTAYKDTKLYI